MIDINGWDALIGAIIPLLVGFLTKTTTPGWVKGAIAFVFAVGAAIIRVLISSEFDVNHIFDAVFVIATTAQVTYSMILKQLAEYLQKIGPIKD
jgi:hypothetical protein